MSERDLYSEQSEHGVLGALMHEPKLCEDVGAFLGQEHFSVPDNGAIYASILSLHSKGLKPDPLALAELLDRLPSGDATMPYAHELWNNTASTANAVHFARVLLERHTARQMYAAGQAIMDLACSKGNIQSQLSEAQAKIMALGQQASSPDVVTYRDLLGKFADDVDRKFNGAEVPGIETGLNDLDAILRKMRPGNLIVVAGKPGTGKTVLVTGIGDKIAIRDKKAVLGFSLEMPKEELVARSVAAAGSVDKGRLDSGQLEDEDWPKFTSAISLLDGADVRICDRPGLTMARICAIARFEYRVRPFELMWVDYLTLIASDPSARHGTRSAEIGSYTRGFKNLAKELGIPIIIVCQLNRSMDSRGADCRPKMTDLRDSGEIEQDADVIILGYRDESSPDGADGLTEWEVPKIRHAKTGRCLLQLQGKYQRFLNSAVSWSDYKSGGETPSRSFKDFIPK